MNGQPPAAENDFRRFERQNPIPVLCHDPGHKVNHTGNLIGNLILKVGLDGTDFVAAFAGQITGSILMGDQDDVLIVQGHQPLQGVQELGTNHVPCPEGIITFVFPPLPVTDKHPASLIDIFQEVNHNGFEGVLFLFQFIHGFRENLIGQFPLGQPAFHGHSVPNGDIGGIHELDVAICVQHQGIRKSVGKEGLAAEGCAVHPHNLFLGCVRGAPLVFGEKHIVPSFHTKFFIFTPTTEVIWFLGELLGFNHVFGIGQEIHHFEQVELYRLHPGGGIGKGFLQTIPELGQTFRVFLPDFHLGNKEEIKVPDPASGVGQLKPILVFVKLPAFHVAFGIVGIFEIKQVKVFRNQHGFLFQGVNIPPPIAHRGQIVNEPDKISVANGDFKPPARGQQRRRLGDHGFQLDHFVDMFIRQNGEAVLVELQRLIHTLFNARVKGCPQN